MWICLCWTWWLSYQGHQGDCCMWPLQHHDLASSLGHSLHCHLTHVRNHHHGAPQQRPCRMSPNLLYFESVNTGFHMLYLLLYTSQPLTSLLNRQMNADSDCGLVCIIQCSLVDIYQCLEVQTVFIFRVDSWSWKRHVLWHIDNIYETTQGFYILVVF